MKATSSTAATLGAALLVLQSGAALNEQYDRQSQESQSTQQQSQPHQHGQSKGQSMTGPGEEILTTDQEELYREGISVDSLLGDQVVDDSGNEVGQVEDMVISSDDNKLVGIIVETGGFLNIGDNHLLYPFDQAQIKDGERIQTDIASRTVKELSLFREIEGEPLEGGRWRVSDLIGSAAYSDGEPYGRVDDVIINKSGNILAVIVQPDVMYDDSSYYAWPYVGFEGDVYDVPAEQRHTFGEEPFEPESLQGAQGTTAGTSQQ